MNVDVDVDVDRWRAATSAVGHNQVGGPGCIDSIITDHRSVFPTTVPPLADPKCAPM